jgi:YHS domain-containing protein
MTRASFSAAIAAVIFSAVAAQMPEPKIAACNADGIALGGYDVVSYFSPSGPTPGKPEFRAEHDGSIYLFLSAANSDAFRESPETYLPAYGGWCATSVAHGARVCPDFLNFKIQQGRLLLFETTAFTNGRAVWETDPEGYRIRADERFARLLGK